MCSAPATSRTLVVVSGPHGAGKDSIVDRMLLECPHVRRLRRITTRAISRDEQLREQYLQVTPERFAQFEASQAILMPKHYPEASTGILRSDIDALGSGIAVTTCNFDDAHSMINTGPSLGLVVRGLFVSPVSYQELWADEPGYLSELELRMRQRARATDEIDVRLGVAARYRREVLAESHRWLILENQRGQESLALQELVRLVA